MIIFGIFPQTGIDRIRCLVIIIKEIISRLTPDNLALLVHQLQRFGCINQSPCGKLCLPSIFKIQL